LLIVEIKDIPKPIHNYLLGTQKDTAKQLLHKKRLREKVIWLGERWLACGKKSTRLGKKHLPAGRWERKSALAGGKHWLGSGGVRENFEENRSLGPGTLGNYEGTVRKHGGKGN
jgi:hypothetical protein